MLCSLAYIPCLSQYVRSVQAPCKLGIHMVRGHVGSRCRASALCMAGNWSALSGGLLLAQPGEPG